MNITVLSPVWAKCDDEETLKRILYIDKDEYKKVTKWKVSSPSVLPGVKEMVRKTFSNVREVSTYKQQLEELYPDVKFEINNWRQGETKKNRVYLYHSVRGKPKEKLFLAGFVKRISQYCALHHIHCTINISSEELCIKATKEPKVKGIDLRSDQLRMVKSATTECTGVLKAPTGSGKTVLAASIISCYPKRKALFLCHTKALTEQTYVEFKNYGFNVTKIEAEKKDPSGDVVVAIMQTFRKQPDSIYNQFDIVIVDEVHHSASPTYQDILERLCCPVRIGLTATLPKKNEAALIIEGLFGPVVDSLSLEEGMERNILAKIVLRLLRVPSDSNVKELSRWVDIYSQGIVNRRALNRLIMKTASEYNSQGETVLILVKEIQHGTNLMEMADILGVDARFVQGSTDDSDREQIKLDFKNKDIGTVIATSVWREGINIPSVGVIINAGGGKDNKLTEQGIGRGLRTTIFKDKVIVIDFLDDSHWKLIEHFGNRMITYSDMGCYQ